MKKKYDLYSLFVNLGTQLTMNTSLCLHEWVYL